MSSSSSIAKHPNQRNRTGNALIQKGQSRRNMTISNCAQALSHTCRLTRIRQTHRQHQQDSSLPLDTVHPQEQMTLQAEKLTIQEITMLRSLLCYTQTHSQLLLFLSWEHVVTRSPHTAIHNHTRAAPGLHYQNDMHKWKRCNVRFVNFVENNINLF